jgi:hypothetical protein
VIQSLSRFLLPLLSLTLLLFRPALGASSYAGEFLALGAGARAVALGGAYTAIVDDATAGYWNPAALANIGQRQVHAMHAQRFSGLVEHSFLAMAVPSQHLDGVALSIMRVGVGNIKFTHLPNPNRPPSANNRPQVSSVETSSDYAVYLSGGQRLNSRLMVGASAKLLYRTVGGFNAYGLGLDLAFRYDLAGGVKLALNLRDATTTPVFWNTDENDSIRPSIVSGLAYARPLGPGTATASFGSRMGGEATDESGADPLNFGFEYDRGKIVLRAGLEEGRQAFGLGLVPHDRLDVDLAYLNHDELESTYQVSLGYRY